MRGGGGLRGEGWQGVSGVTECGVTPPAARQEGSCLAAAMLLRVLRWQATRRPA